MAKRQDGNDDGNGSATEGNENATASASRRTLLKGIGAVATLGGGAALASDPASAAGDFGEYLGQSGETTIPAGEYSWNDDDLELSSGDALVGEGNPGDVVVNLESGTMDGWIEGRLENVVVRGRNTEARAGLYVASGCEIDGFVWTDGGNESRDRALYNPDGGERAVVRNSAWAWMGNNGAYCDKLPMTFENCVAANSNISNIRVGHRDGSDVDATTYVRNCLIAVTDVVRNDDTNTKNARGLRFRQPGNFVIENCHFVALDVEGVGYPVVAHDGAAGSSITLRNCHFYNDSGKELVRDKTGDIDWTIENCTVQGSGSSQIGPDYSGSGVAEKAVSFPLPSEVTGYAEADDIAGIEPGVGPWGSGSGSTTTTASPTDWEHTLVIEASEDNPTGTDARVGDFDLDVVVSGDATFGEHAEPRDDYIASNADGTTTINVQDLQAGELDSFRFNGELVDYVVDSGYEFTVSLDGTTTTFDELVNGDTTTTTSDSTTTTSDSTSTSDSTTTSTDGDRTDDPALPSNRITITGGSTDSPSNYKFSVSGDVVRDTEMSQQTADGVGWDRIEDIAKNGKVIGLVGSGVDAYRFDGNITSIRIDGDASFYVERGV